MHRSGDDEQLTREAINNYKDALIGIAANNSVNPPETMDVLNQQELEDWANTKEMKWTEGLTIRPQKFIRTVISRRTNAVDGAGSAVDEAGDHDEEEDGETMKDEELKKQIVH